MCTGEYQTKEELEEIFELRGNELWRKEYVRSNGMVNKPKKVVNKKNTAQGYCCVRLKGLKGYYHTIIWILINGGIPNGEGWIIDHIDGNKINNNIENLRLVNSRENQSNTYKHRNGRLVGCSFLKATSKWRAQIALNCKKIDLGCYLTEQQAHEMYCFVRDNIDNLHTKDEVQGYARTHHNCTLRRKSTLTHP